MNNPARAERDWLDIRLLLEAAGRAGRAVDWELVRDYLGIFRLEDRLDGLKSLYGQTERR